MYALTAPGKDLLRWARGRGRELGQRATVFSGSNAAEGPVTTAIRTYVTKKGPLSKEISIEERNDIIEAIAKKEGVTPQEVNNMLINEAVASRAQQLRKSKQRVLFNNPSASAMEDRYLRQAMIHHADVLESMASSVSGRASLGNALDNDIRNQQINISALSASMREVTAATVRAEVKASGKKLSEAKIQKLIEKNMIKQDKDWAEYSAEELSRKNPKYVTLSHFDNFGIRFGSNRQHGKNLLLDDAAEQKHYVAPAKVFFRNGGLRTPENFEKASTEMLTSLGLVKGADGVWNTTDESAKDLLCDLVLLDVVTSQDYWNRTVLPALKKLGFVKGDV
jgi:hypothetical protein